jgi:hypothetical protein
MSDPIQDAIAAAALAAKNAPEALPATQPAGNNVVAFQPAGPPTVLKTSEMMVGSFSVDAYIKVSKDGMTIGDSAIILDAFQAAIDMGEVFNYFGVKFGNPAVYEKTTNKQVSLSGKSWAQVLQTATQVDGAKFRGDYRSADVPFTLLQDVKDIKGVVVATKGQRIGKSLSTTEWKEWELFVKTLQRLGHDVDTVLADLEVCFKARSNAQNKWGVLTFLFKGESSPADLEDAA